MNQDLHLFSRIVKPFTATDTENLENIFEQYSKESGNRYFSQRVAPGLRAAITYLLDMKIIKPGGAEVMFNIA